jgi:hypothetical protein
MSGVRASRMGCRGYRHPGRDVGVRASRKGCRRYRHPGRDAENTLWSIPWFQSWFMIGMSIQLTIMIWVTLSKVKIKCPVWESRSSSGA